MIDLSKKAYIINDIDEVSFREFSERLDEIEEILEGDDIHIELMSHGGDALVALAFYDRIRSSKSNIIITAYGIVASAAVLVLAAGDLRRMSKSSWVMVHEDTVIVEEDSRVSRVEKNAKIARRLEVQWAKLLSDMTITKASVWEKLHKDETYLSASECLKLGLIEEII